MPNTTGGLKYNQILTEAERTKNKHQWYKDVVEELSLNSLYEYRGGIGDINGDSYHDYNECSYFEYSKMLNNYQSYNGRIKVKDIKEATGYGKITEEENTHPQYENIIKLIIDKLKGSKFSRRSKSQIVSLNDNVKNRYKDLQAKKVAQGLLKLTEEVALAGLEGDPEPAKEQLQQKIKGLVDNRDTGDAFERVLGLFIAEHEKDSYNAQQEEKSFEDELITGRGIIWLDERRGRVRLRRVNPLRIRFSLSSDLTDIHYSDWVIHREYLKYSEIIELYGDELTKEQLQKLKPLYTRTENINHGYFYNNHFNGSSSFINGYATHVVWRGLKEYEIIQYVSTSGEIKVVSMPPAIKGEKNTPIDLDTETAPRQKKYVETIYQATKLADGIYVDMREASYMKRRKVHEDVYLPFFGVLHNKNNTKSHSIIDSIWYYQLRCIVISHVIQRLNNKNLDVLLEVDTSMFLSNEATGKNIVTHVQNMVQDGILMTYREDGTSNKSAINLVNTDLASVIGRYEELRQVIIQNMYSMIGLDPSFFGNISDRQSVANANLSLQQTQSNVNYLYNRHDHYVNLAKSEMLNIVKDRLFDPEYIHFTRHNNSSVDIAFIEAESSLLEISEYALKITQDPVEALEIQRMKEVVANAFNAGHIEFTAFMSINNASSLQEMRDEYTKALTESEEKQQAIQQQQFEQAQELERQKQENQEAIITLEHQNTLEQIEAKQKGENDQDGVNDNLENVDKAVNIAQKIKE